MNWTSIDPLLVELASCARQYVPEAPVAYGLARECLVDALAGALAALRDPACTKLLGPIVPGATMMGGARVPGTSFELDPVKAAFDLGTLINWCVPDTAEVPVGIERTADCLGGILAAADWHSRTRLATGGEPLTVRQLLRMSSAAHEIQRMLGRDGVAEVGHPSRASRARIATAATVTAMLGGTHGRVLAAASYAVLDGAGAQDDPIQRSGRAPARWALGDATSRGVRLALIALAEEPAGSLAQAHACAPAIEQPSALVPHSVDHPSSPRCGAEVTPSDRFRAAVRAHYSARQATAIEALFTDPAALDAKPVHELVSALAHN